MHTQAALARFSGFKKGVYKTEGGIMGKDGAEMAGKRGMVGLIKTLLYACMKFSNNEHFFLQNTVMISKFIMVSNNPLSFLPLGVIPCSFPITSFYLHTL